jgi:hypothetical protein
MNALLESRAFSNVACFVNYVRTDVLKDGLLSELAGPFNRLTYFVPFILDQMKSTQSKKVFRNQLPGLNLFFWGLN